MRAAQFAFAAVAVATLTVLPATNATADESGMASIHSWRKVGRKTCLVDHNHSGSGTGPSQKQAEASAIRSWADFTSLEYGSSWASFGNAIERQVTCSRSTSGFSCDIVATPCRPW